MTLPKCAALGCDDYADPRWYICGPEGKRVMACDGHGALHRGGVCDCPPFDPAKFRPPMPLWGEMLHAADPPGIEPAEVPFSSVASLWPEGDPLEANRERLLARKAALQAEIIKIDENLDALADLERLSR